MIKLIATDLDGTALNGGNLSQKNQMAIRRAIDSGIEFAIATGRGICGITDELYEISGLKYAITSNGACISNFRTGEILGHFTLDGEDVKKLNKVGKKLGLTYEIFVNGKAYVDQKYYDDPVSFGQFPRLVPYIRATRTPVPDIEEFIAQNINQVENFVMVTPDENIHKKCSGLVRDVNINNYVVDSEPQWIEVMSPKSNKCEGLRLLCDYLKIDFKDVAAFGDGMNDLEMIELSGLGIAMDNAVAELKKAADVITLSCEEDGLAYGISKILDSN